jgi:hypothetical protein
LWSNFQGKEPQKHAKITKRIIAQSNRGTRGIHGNRREVGDRRGKRGERGRCFGASVFRLGRGKGGDYEDDDDDEDEGRERSEMGPLGYWSI